MQRLARPRNHAALSRLGVLGGERRARRCRGIVAVL